MWPGARTRASIWTNATYIDTTGLSEAETLGRDASQTDTNVPDDWESGGVADPYGSDSEIETPGAVNIPEFDEYVTGLLSVAVIMIIITGKKKKCERP